MVTCWMWSASGSEGARARARAEDDCRGRGRDLDLDRSTNDRLGATLKENPFARVLLELVHRDPDVRSMDPQIAAVDLILRFRYVIVILCGGSPSLNFFDSLLVVASLFSICRMNGKWNPSVQLDFLICFRSKASRC